MSERKLTVVRLPDAACKIWGGIRNPEDRSGFALTMIVGMYAVDDRTIYVEIPFSDFAPDFSKVNDFKEMAFAQLRKTLGNRKVTIEEILEHCWHPKMCVSTTGKIALELTGLYRVDGSLSHAYVQFSEFAPDFGKVSDFEGIVANCLREWYRVFGGSSPLPQPQTSHRHGVSHADC